MKGDMKLVDLSYLRHNMTSVEEIDVENFQHIKDFLDRVNFTDWIINLDFLQLGQMKIGKTNGLWNFSIDNNKAGIIVYTEEEKETYLKFIPENKTDDEKTQTIKIQEMFEELEAPFVIVPTSLSVVGKEAVYHLFMFLQTLEK